MEKHFTTYKHHNDHHYYNIMYYQRFVFKFNLNFMTLNQFEIFLIEDCSLYIYTLMCKFILKISN
jgi:hypothetical protein